MNASKTTKLTTNGKQTLLKLSFPPDPQTLKRVKLLPGRKYENKGNERYWTVPATIPTLTLLSKWGFTFAKQVDRWLAKTNASRKTPKIKNLGGTLRPLQSEAVKLIHKMQGRALLADPMGTGKTVITLSYCQLRSTLRPIVVLCPANAKVVWERHAYQWLDNPNVTILSGRGSTSEIALSGNDVVICNYDIIGSRYVSDTKAQRRIMAEAGKKLSKPQITAFKNIQKKWDKFINPKWDKYELVGVRPSMWDSWIDEDHPFNQLLEQWLLALEKEEIPGWLSALQDINPQILILDEAHKLKNSKAERTHAAKALCKITPKTIGISGTPIERHPSEFYNILSWLRPEWFGNWKWYVTSFCDFKQTKFGTDWSGATNTEELCALLPCVMIRRKKEDILPELPPKQRIAVPLDVDLTEYGKASRDILSYLKETKGDNAAKRAKRAKQLVTVNTLRQLAVKAKLTACISWVEDYLESDEKLVVFAYHREIVQKIFQHFKKQAVIVQGGITQAKRTQAMDAFQEDDRVRLFVGNIEAANESITLTAAKATATIEFVEKPGTHFQAEDRVHRLGVTDNVFAYYLVACNTIEEDLVRVLNKRERILAEILDGRKVTDKIHDNMFLDLLNLLEGEPQQA